MSNICEIVEFKKHKKIVRLFDVAKNICNLIKKRHNLKINKNIDLVVPIEMSISKKNGFAIINKIEYLIFKENGNEWEITIKTDNLSSYVTQAKIKEYLMNIKVDFEK